MLFAVTLAFAVNRAEFCLVSAQRPSAATQEWKIDLDCGSGPALTGPFAGKSWTNLPDLLAEVTDEGWALDAAWAGPDGDRRHYLLLRRDIGVPVQVTARTGNAAIAERICRKVYVDLQRDPGAAWEHDLTSVTAYLDAGFTEADALTAIDAGRKLVPGTVAIADYLYAGAKP